MDNFTSKKLPNYIRYHFGCLRYVVPCYSNINLFYKIRFVSISVKIKAFKTSLNVITMNRLINKKKYINVNLISRILIKSFLYIICINTDIKWTNIQESYNNNNKKLINKTSRKSLPLLMMKTFDITLLL